MLCKSIFYWFKKNPFIQLIKIENDFVKEFGIKNINSWVDSNVKINLKKVIISAQLSYKNEEKLLNYSKDSLINLKDYNNDSLIEDLKCEYFKDSIRRTYINYLIITKNMRTKKCDTIFIDCTYKIIPPGLKKYKFFVILGFDDWNNKLILYLYALINHENKQNFFNYI